MQWNYQHEYYRTGSSPFDPDSMQPTLEFVECLGFDSSQDATGIFDATIATF